MEWIASYLKNRYQQVLANGTMSDSRKVKQGVPQGSTLGPLFYILYANDIPNKVTSKIALYADDTALYSSSMNPNTITRNLQKDMDSLAQWCSENDLTINASKTKVMLFGSKKARDKLKDLNITFNGEGIEQVTSYNYLGV